MACNHGTRMTVVTCMSLAEAFLTRIIKMESMSFLRADQA